MTAEQKIKSTIRAMREVADREASISPATLESFASGIDGAVKPLLNALREIEFVEDGTDVRAIREIAHSVLFDESVQG